LEEKLQAFLFFGPKMRGSPGDTKQDVTLR